MARWFILVLTALFLTGYLALAEFTPAPQQIVNILPAVRPSSPTLALKKPEGKVVMGIVRHVEPVKGIVILETDTDLLVVRAPVEVCRKLHEGDMVVAALAPEEEKILI